jgi:dTDP-4-dehydrorhamnose reductase
MTSSGPVVVFGGNGQLGTAFRRAFAHDVIAPAHDVFDIVSGDAQAFLAPLRPSVVVNFAAFHNVDRCEREPGAAFAANAIAVDRLASVSQALGAVFVTVSTDYVFSGTADRPYREDDRPAPRTAYGTSKFAGELLAARSSQQTIVVRTSGVFGTTGTSSKGYTLIDKVLGQAERGEVTRMVDDMTFSPSFAPHVARAIVDLIDHRAYGLHHVTNAGSCTWYEFVETAFAKAGLRDAPLEATTYAMLNSTTQRPQYSPLENTTFAALGIAPMPTWQRALDDYLEIRAAREPA